MVGVVAVRGGVPLQGSVRVRGAKNLVPKAMVAALLAPGVSVLRNVPDVADVSIVAGLLGLHGVGVERDVEGGTVVVDAARVANPDVSEVVTHGGTSRIPVLFCGPLLHRLGRAFIPDLGGCRIGDRPIDFHLDALRAFGAVVDKRPDGLDITAPNGLRGPELTLPYPSVGATEQVLLTAVLAQGVTELRNAALEPEVLDLIAVLQKMGALIAVRLDRVIRVSGARGLRGYTHRAIPDRIEAASWASAALATRGDVYVAGARQGDLMTFLNVFRTAGGEFDVDDEGIRFWHPGGELAPLALETDVHPGFMTDWQQPLAVALTQADGLSILHETVYENRLGFLDALSRMGATVQPYRECLGATPCRFGARNYTHSAVICGPAKLEAAELSIPDLRGGFSHVIAALAAQGTSTIDRVEVINRGYESFTDKLTGLGADIEPVGCGGAVPPLAA